MRDPSSSRPRPASGHSWLWHIRHSPATGGAALVLFLAVSALWLVAAGTAHAAIESQPCGWGGCPQPPSYTSLHVWLLLGIAGAVLTVVSFVLLVRRVVGERRKAGTAPPPPWHWCGEGFCGSARQSAVPVGAGFGHGQRWSASVAWCLAVERSAPGAWSLEPGTIPLVVNAKLIAGAPWVTNVGAWWPGLFAAMVALTLLAAAGAPGMTSRAEDMAPFPPSASDRAASPAAAP